MSKVVIKVTGLSGGSLYVRRLTKGKLGFDVAIWELAQEFPREEAEQLVERFTAAVARKGLTATFDLVPVGVTT